MVLPHAVEQARERLHIPGGDNEVKLVIEFRVRQACERGQLYDRKPRAFCMYADTRRPVPPWQRIAVWGEDQAFVIDVARLPRVDVITCITRLPKIGRQ